MITWPNHLNLEIDGEIKELKLHRTIGESKALYRDLELDEYVIEQAEHMKFKHRPDVDHSLLKLDNLPDCRDRYSEKKNAFWHGK